MQCQEHHLPQQMVLFLFFFDLVIVFPYLYLDGFPPPSGEQEGTFGDLLKHIWGLTEPFLWIQLVAEGSSSTWRAFGVAMAKARRVNDESSTFQ